MQTARAPNLVQHSMRSGCHVLHVSGPVTYTNAREVLARALACPGALDFTDRRTLLDLSHVTATDWEGLGALLALLTRLQLAADGAHVVGPDGVELAAHAVKGARELVALLKAPPWDASVAPF